MGNPGTRYSRESKVEAVSQVVDRGYSVREVAARIGVCEHSLYWWVQVARRADEVSADGKTVAELAAENASLKKERVRRRTYRSVAEARADVFDYIEVFYNRKRRHEHLGGMSPVEFEEQRLVA